MLSLLANRVSFRAAVLNGNASLLRRVVTAPRTATQLSSRTFLTTAPLATPVEAEATQKKRTRTSTKAKTETSTPSRTKAKTAAKKPAAKPATRVAKKTPKLTATERAKKLKFTPEELPPKHPVTSYILYFRHFLTKQPARPASIEEIGKMSKQCAQEWRQLSDAEKEPFAAESKRLREIYKAEKEAYMRSVSPETLTKVNANRKANGKRGVRVPSELKVSKKALAPYIRFLEENRERFTSTAPADTPRNRLILWVAKRAGEEWKQLSDEAKEPYVTAWKAERDALKA